MFILENEKNEWKFWAILFQAKIKENQGFGSINESNNHVCWLWLFDSFIPPKLWLSLFFV